MTGERQAAGGSDRQLCAQALLQSVETAPHHHVRHALGQGRSGQAAMGHDLNKCINFLEAVHRGLWLIRYLEYRMKVPPMQFPNRTGVHSIGFSLIQLCTRKPDDPHDRC